MSYTLISSNDNLFEKVLDWNANDTLIKEPLLLDNYLDEKVKPFFKINNPRIICINFLKEKQMKSITGRLVAKKINFKLSFLPSGWFKSQRSDLYSIELDLYRIKDRTNKEITLNLISYGSSYGEILLNGIKCDLSHSCCSSIDSKYDSAQCWEIVSEQEKVIDLLIG
jgi:hypothetical protein